MSHRCISAALVLMASVASADIVAHWKFDETPGSPIAADQTGTYPGTLLNSATFLPAGGKVNGAIQLSRATNDLVSMGDVLNLNSGHFSIAFWMKTADTTQSFPVAKHRSGIVAGWICAANVSGGTYGLPNKAWFYNGNAPGGEVRSTSDVNDDQWHHIVVSFTAGATKRIYVDGAPAEGTTAANAFSSINAPMLVGGLEVAGSPANLYEGLVDDLQIYNRPLSAADVQYLFDNPGQTSCLGDYTRDASNDFFDVIAFLSDFAATIERADTNQDGSFDFFDVVLFLGSFAAGCP